MRIQYLFIALAAVIAGIGIYDGIAESFRDKKAAECAELAWYYGVAETSPKEHARLPDGVRIEYSSGACRRTDTREIVDEYGRG